MTAKKIPFNLIILLALLARFDAFGEAEMQQKSPVSDANDCSVAIDCAKVEYFPLLRTKFGVAKTLATKSLDEFHRGLKHVAEFDPAIFNIPLNFSTLREKPQDPHSSKNALTDPYPIYLGESGETCLEPPNAELLKAHRALQAERIVILHQLMGAPRPWYNEDPTLNRLPEGAKKPFHDDRFPVPTDVPAAADAMGQWCNLYQESFPINWGIWQEACHYLRNKRPDLGGPEYADIVLNYVRYIRQHASPEGISRQTFGLQMLPRNAAQKSDALKGSEMGDSFLEAVLYSMEKGLKPGEKISDFIDCINLNNYRATMGKKEMDFHSELRPLRSIMMRYGLNSVPFVYTQMTLGDKLVDRSGERDRYKQRIEAALDLADLWLNLLAAVDVDIVCWDFLLGAKGSQAMFSLEPGEPALYTPRAQALRLIRGMPTRRVFSQTDADIQVLSAVSEKQKGDLQDGAAMLIWSQKASAEPLYLNLSIDNLPEALFADEETRLYVYRIDEAHCTGWTEAAKPIDIISATRKNGVVSTTIAMNCPGLIFIRVGADLPINLQPGFTAAQYCKKLSYCDRSDDSENKISDSYGIYDYKYSRAYLGVKGAEGRAIAGAVFQEMPDTMEVAVQTDNVASAKNANAILGLRIDYFDDKNESIKSALWPSPILSKIRTRELPWGKAGATADVIADTVLSLNAETTLDIAKYAPKSWNRKVILSFWMEGTGEGSMAQFRLSNSGKNAKGE